MGRSSMLRKGFNWYHPHNNSVLRGWRETRSFAASNNNQATAVAEVPTSAANKVRGKKERRNLLVPFVNQYRATNDGKFPNASYAKKHVGGSYYVIKSILQELEYAAKKMSSSCGGIEHSSLGISESGSFIQFEDNSTLDVSESSAGIPNVSEVTIDADLSDAGDRDSESKRVCQTTSSEEILPKEAIIPASGSDTVDTTSYIEKEAQADGLDYVARDKHLPIGDGIRASSSSEVKEDVTKPDLNNSSKKEQNEGIPQLYKLSNNQSGEPADDAEPPQRLTLWGTMKSIADGVISIFRK